MKGRAFEGCAATNECTKITAPPPAAFTDRLTGFRKDDLLVSRAHGLFFIPLARSHITFLRLDSHGIQQVNKTFRARPAHLCRHW